MGAKRLMQIGCVIIAVSTLIQIGALLLSPTHPIPAITVGVAGLLINGAIIPLTILQANKSAVELQQQFEQAYERTIDREPYDGTSKRQVEETRKQMRQYMGIKQQMDDDELS
jgi:hypothetical protein